MKKTIYHHTYVCDDEALDRAAEELAALVEYERAHPPTAEDLAWSEALPEMDDGEGLDRVTVVMWGGGRMAKAGGTRVNAIRLFTALEFAAHKHRHKRRKDADASPYVNHLIAVTRILAAEGGVTDDALLVAAVLHDTVEDTETTFEELERAFDAEIAALVREVTDDVRLVKDVRKQRQIDRAPQLSSRAKALRIADKIANLRDLMARPPVHWPIERKQTYLRWAEQVVAGCRGLNPALDAAFDETVERARAALV